MVQELCMWFSCQVISCFKFYGAKRRVVMLNGGDRIRYWYVKPDFHRTGVAPVHQCYIMKKCTSYTRFHGWNLIYTRLALLHHAHKWYTWNLLTSPCFRRNSLWMWTDRFKPHLQMQPESVLCANSIILAICENPLI